MTIRNCFALGLLPLAALLLSCGGGGGGGGDTEPDPNPAEFRVQTTDPRPGSGGLSDKVAITILFTKEVDGRTLDGNSVRLRRRSTGAVQTAELRLSPDARRVTLVPDGRLVLKAVYDLYVSVTLKDQTGAALGAEFAGSYTIGSFPDPERVRQDDFRTLTSHMRVGRSDHTATLVTTDGGTKYVVLIGGFTQGRSQPTGTAEIVNVDDLAPEEDDGFIFSDAGAMATARAYHTATQYRPGAGLVLVAGGGTGQYGTQATADCQTWVLSVNGFRDAADMNVARRLHAATLITGTGTSLDGQILVTGGQPFDTAGDTAEIYDPAADTWTLLPARMHDIHEGHQSTLLTKGPLKGKVLITGGGTDIAEIFDPVTRTFTEVPDATNSFRWLFSAVELTSGQVLLSDGGEQQGELFDPYTQTFDTVASANRLERYAPVAFRFTFPPGRGPVSGGPADNVLIVGGATYVGGNTTWIAHGSVEQFVLGTSGTGAYYGFDPAEGEVDLGDPRAFSAGCDLGDGRLLVTGGIPGSSIGVPQSNRNLDTVLLFEPKAD